MQALYQLLILPLWTTFCLAQFPSPPLGSVLPPAAPPRPPTTTTTTTTSSLLTTCAPGNLIPGPSCTSFYMCVGWLTSPVRRVKFHCAPGTVFSWGLKTCVHGDGAQCGSTSPTLPIAPTGPSLPQVPTSPPAVIASPAPPAPTAVQDSCPQYQVDGTGVYECLEPGYYPSASDCSKFYQCVVTMGCVIKGILFRCPEGYIFDTGLKRCGNLSVVGQCDRLSDAVVQTHEIRPVPIISPKDLDQFFDSQIYWDVMPFLPDQQQKVVPILPSSYSRGADRSRSGKGHLP